MSQPPNQRKDTLPMGRIDIHCHLLPGIDDGCETMDEAIETVETMMKLGYVASIVTPHFWEAYRPDWPELFETISVDNVERWASALREALLKHGLNYTIYTGGELRLGDDMVELVNKCGLPKLGDTNYVLTDYFGGRWDHEINTSLTWLLDQGYRPILAHPERLGLEDDEELEDHLLEVKEQGVLLQGNLQSLSGDLGPVVDRRIRKWLQAGHYTFLASDGHRLPAIHGRIEGLYEAQALLGDEQLNELTMHAPRRMLSLASHGFASHDLES